MESSAGENLCSVIQYYKGPDTGTNNAEVPNSFETQNSVNENIKKENLSNSIKDINHLQLKQESNCDKQKDEASKEFEIKIIKPEKVKSDIPFCSNINELNIINKSNELQETSCSTGKAESQTIVVSHAKTEPIITTSFKFEDKKAKAELSESAKQEKENDINDVKVKETELKTKDENLELLETEVSIKGKKRKLSEANVDNESVTASVASAEEAEGNEDGLESEFEEDEEDAGNKPRRRGRSKKNPDIIPPYLSSDIILGYKILLKFLETPQFSGFHKPFKKNTESEYSCRITCLNQIKKKFEENLYEKVSEFVSDVREMLINIYESRNQVAIKKALRLEQILEQRIAQLPNYLRPQCALALSSDEVNNSNNKIRITKGGGFVSLLLEKTEKKRYEKNREKRKLLAEERKQLKEEQNKDVQEWEKNVLMKDFEEDIKSMWELPAIGHFIHLCADIFNIGEVAQFEVERMLLMPQCSDTLDLIMTALLTNSLVRAKLDRTPSMPYSIWGPLVRTRVMSWYRMWHRDGRNEQKIFEEIGIEPEFWQILGPQINPLDYYYFHEISLFQRVWILKTLCDVDFVRKKTVYDNIRAQTLDELSPINLGFDQHGNRYIQFKQFCGSDIRIYRQSTKLEGDITPSDLIESIEGFEYREGPITAEKVFKDIWELNEKLEIKPKKKKMIKSKKTKSFNAKVTVEPAEKKNLRQSAREKQKTYVDWSDSDLSDTDLRTLRNKLLKSDTETLYRPFSDKEFISLSVFRLPREKVNKPGSKRSSYAGRKTEDASRNEGDKSIKGEPEDRKVDTKPSGGEDEQSDSLDVKHIQNMQTIFEKNFHGDDINDDEFDLREKINNCELDNSDVKFTVKNLENLKMVFKKGSSVEGEEPEENISGTHENSESEENTSTREKEYDALYKYNVPNRLKPNSSKFYLVVDSVEGLRQLISKFGSHENDLEIITRSTKSKKKNSNQSNTSSEVQLIEKLQNLLLELEPWELDLMKSSRLNKEKMYKEYMNFMSRPPDFVHPNEAYWMKTYEEPNPTTSSASTTTTIVTSTADGILSTVDKHAKEGSATIREFTDVSQQDPSLDTLGPRKRTRVTRMQLQPESDDLDEDFDDGDDYESNESDDNWVLPTPKKRAKKETTNRTPKLPKRSIGKRMKSSPFEKIDSQTNTGEKYQGFSPEKVKKALFWGPRSTDPSEDLNWETNRQKILEQHNSPVKKLLKSDETTNDLFDSETRQNIQKLDTPTQSVIIASPKRLTSPIPGNKKPYFSSAQLKAIESQTKKVETGELQPQFFVAKPDIPKPETKITSNTNTDITLPDSDNKTLVKMQTYSRVKIERPTPTGGVNCQSVSRLVQQSPKQGGNLAVTGNSQVVRYGPQVCSVISDGETERKPMTQVQIHQTDARPQQIQIQEMSQNRVITSVANIKVQQPVQWQQKVISIQPVNQPGKIIQQQGQIQTQIQNEPQGQIPDQTMIQIQEQGEQTTQKSVAVQQVPPEKLGNFIQMVTMQAQTGAVSPDGDFYVTDGKNLMKFDNNFVHQLQKDKVTLGFKKTLLLVKPKADSNQSGEAQMPTAQQNILMINKPPAVQPTVSTTSVPNFVIPANYIIKEGSQQTQEQGQQTVKVVQQSPAYVIQQKPIIGKSLQPQVIKIITSQPMASNQNIILTPLTGPVIQPVSQSVSPEQQTKPPTTLRLVRPQIATSVTSNSAQNKINLLQSPIIVNNIVQIQGQRLDASKPQAPVVAGRILSTAVPTVRMATPQTQLVTQTKSQTTQPQTVVASTNPQSVRSNVIAQSMSLATVSQVETSAAGSSPRFVVSTTQAVRTTTSQSLLHSSPSSNQTVRFAPNFHQTATSSNAQISGMNTQQVRLSSAQPHTVIQTASVNPQLIKSMGNVNTQTFRLVSQPQEVQTQTLVASTDVNSQISGPSSNLNAQSMKIVQPQQYQTQTIVPCVNLNSQGVRLATSVGSQPIRFLHSQPVKLIANNSVGVKFINRNPAPVKATVITNAAQTPVIGASNVKSSGVVSQPVQYQTVVQPSGVRPVQNRMQLAYTKKPVNANTANAPILIIEEEEEEEEDVMVLGEKSTETSVRLDYINGELSVKRTSQGWKYAVRAQNGKDIILTDEQIEERLKANKGVMK